MKTTCLLSVLAAFAVGCSKDAASPDTSSEPQALTVSPPTLGLPVDFVSKAETGGVQLSWNPGEALTVIGGGSSNCFPRVGATALADRILVELINETPADAICFADAAVFWVTVDLQDDYRNRASLVVEVIGGETVTLE